MNRTQDGPRRWLAAAISRRVLGVTTALLLLGVFITLPSPAAAQTATVTASGSTSGGQATLTVSISGVTNLISAGFRVGFNPAEVLTTPLPSGVSGGFLNVSPFVNPNSAGNGVGFVLLNGAAASGSGVLGVLTFTLASGVTSTTFTISGIDLKNSSDATITSNTVSPVTATPTGGPPAPTAPNISTINDPPAIPLSGTTGAILFTITDNDPNAVVVTPSTSNSLVSVQLSGTGSMRSVTVNAGATPGSTDVTLTATDNDGLGQDAETFTVTVSPSSMPPSVSVTGVATRGSGTLTVTITASNVTDLASFGFALTYNTTVATFDSAQAGSFLGGSPLANEATPGRVGFAITNAGPATGSGSVAQFTFTDLTGGEPNFFAQGIDLQDSQGAGITSNLTATIAVNGSGGNTAPTITDVGNQTITRDTSTYVLGFTVGDLQDAAGNLIVTRTSSDTTLVPTANVVLGGSGPNRTVQVTPAVGQTGMTTITLRVTDTDGSPLFAEDTFIVTVNASGGVSVSGTGTFTGGQFLVTVNVASVTDLSNVGFVFGFNPAEAAFASRASGGFLNGAPFNVPPTATSVNFVMVGGGGKTGSGALATFTFNAVGGATAATFNLSAIQLSDSGGVDILVNASATIVVNGGGNTAPTITDVGNQTITRDTSTAVLPFTVGDAEEGAGNLMVTGTSSDTTLVPTVGIVLGGFGANRNVQVTPLLGQTGTTTITLRVTDNDGSPRFAEDTFIVTVNAPSNPPGGGGNTPPTISSIADQTTAPGIPTAQIPFTIADSATTATNLVVTASSNDQSVIPNGNILLGGTGSSRSVIILPFGFNPGSATITLTVTDAGGLTATTSFVLSIGGAPSINVPSDQSIAQDTSTGSLPFIVSDSTTPATSLFVTAASSDPTLVPAANILFGGSGLLRAVLVSPTAGRTGTVTITLTVEDGAGLTASASFLLTVTADTTPAGGDTFPMILVQGFNLITFTGPDGATPRQFAELIGTGRVGGIFRFNGVSQLFDSFFLSAPTFVNSLFNLTSRDPLFVLITPRPPDRPPTARPHQP